MLGIRVDANEMIASGHLMRCLSIAKQYVLLGKDVLFITSDDETVKIINEYGFECVATNIEYKIKDLEIPVMRQIIHDREIDILLIDSYQVTSNYFDELKKIVKISYIDDLNAFKYNVDLLINYTYGTTSDVYKHFNYDKAVKFLLGSAYIPLRSEFINNKIEINNKVKSVFLTTGGTDLFGVVESLLKVLTKKELYLEIVVGQYYNNYEKLLMLSEKLDNINVYRNINDISKIMKKCDVAISAGGTTLAELSAMGIPTICFSMADNQIYGTEAYSKAGMMCYAGDVRKGLDELISNIINLLEKIVDDYNLRVKLNQVSNRLIDGMGAKRIAIELERI